MVADALIEDLAEDIVAFRSAHFVLRDDLANLARCRRIGAIEGAIFYGARILEALAAVAMTDTGEDPHDNLFANLETLRHFQLMSDAAASFTHTLRRMGNDVRHVKRRMREQEADIALVFVLWSVEWYFCAFPLGQRLPRSTRDGRSLLETTGGFVPSLLRKLEDLDDIDSARRLWDDQRAALLESPALASRLAERLIDYDAAPPIEEILALAHERFPEDLRIAQLRGLYLGRRGRHDEAARILEELLARVPDDEETIGIFAGVRKRQSRTDPKALEHAFELYRQGWKRHSKRTNVYLGINAAATALWLGRPDSQVIAAEVLAVLKQRAKTVESRLSGARAGAIPCSHWEDLTWAEAELLLGNMEEARGRYLAAFDRHGGGRAAALAVAQGQLERNLRHLGHPMTIAEFLQRAP